MLPEWLKPILFVLGYVVLMRWILPALGIPTCVSGGCRIPEASRKPRSDASQDGEASGTNTKTRLAGERPTA